VPRDHLIERVGWGLVALLAISLTGSVWAASSVFPGAPVLEVVGLAAALAGLWRCWSSPAGPSRAVQAGLLGAVTLALGATAAATILAQPFYGTDSVAFGQYAAHLALAGANPYTHSMAPSLVRYQVPVSYTTHTLSGGVMTSMSYPAGSFLPYMIPLALGWHTQAAVVVDIVAWVFSMLLAWWLAPARVSWLAAVLLASGVYADYAIGGVTDTLYLPALILAVWRWDRFGVKGAGLARFVGPFALGLAATVKQTPWFFVPFLVVGVCFESHARGERWVRVGAAYLGIVLAVFALLDAPWIVADPGAFWHGAVAPLVDSFTPLGLGIVNLTVFDGIGGGGLSWLNDAAIAWLALAGVALVVSYRKTKPVWPILVVCAFFFTSRSLGNYFLYLAPAALVAAATVAPAADGGPLEHLPPPPILAGLAGRRVRRLGADGGLGGQPPNLRSALAFPAVGIAGLGVAACLIGFVASPSPLRLAVTSIATNGQQQLVTEATVAVTNTTSEALRPHFAVADGGYISNFWRTSRTCVIPAHSRRLIPIVAPDVASMPSTASPFEFVAYTASPESVSASAPYQASHLSTYLTPPSFDAPVRVGQRVRMQVQVLNRLGRPQRQAGVRVELGQVTYAEYGLLGGTASINGSPEGRSPMTAVTGPAGVATFEVVGVQPSGPSPDYFQAWIDNPNGPPLSYSELVSVDFTG
jgi:hypothetical protein